MILLPLLAGCSEQLNAPVPSSPAASETSQRASAAICAGAVRETLSSEIHRHRRQSIACNGDPECLEAERVLHMVLAEEIRRDYIACKRALR